MSPLLPLKSQGEITLFGTGGGYGESIACHIGNHNWIIIDSCINPITKKSIPLDYLKEIGVDVKTDVKLILCTHWDNDHIEGISDILRESTSAIFSMAKVTDLKKFLRLLAFDCKKEDFNVSQSSTYEFNQCLDIISARKQKIRYALPDRNLFSINNNGIISQVFALSPSDATIDSFDYEISQLIQNFGSPNKKLIIDAPNDKSVALYLKLGNHSAILGADLELNADANKGWLAILNQSQVIDQKSNFFKIPHHGSSNGYCLDVWKQIINIDAITTLTPWNRGSKLPKFEMVNKYKEHTNKLYITSLSTLNTNKNSPKKRNRSILKMMRNSKFNIKIEEVKFERGIIQCRIDLLKNSDEWSVKLFDSATQLV